MLLCLRNLRSPRVRAGQNDTCLPDSCPMDSCKCTDGKLPYIPTWFAVPLDSDYMYVASNETKLHGH
jgi:hypothetical protein